MKTLFISILFLWATFFQQSNTNSSMIEKKTEGIVTYSFEYYGKKQIETHLYFNNQQAKYNRHHESSTKITDEGYQLDYVQENYDWYFKQDSLALFVSRDNYPDFFARWQTNQIEWEITDETQMIEGFLATKAITKSLHKTNDTQFKFGKAIAWFTTEIPISYGPDGYHGLPGLIVKLEYSEKKRIYKTTLKSIEYKEVEDWQLPNTDKKLEVTQDQAYNYWNYGKKWFKKKAKEMGL